MNSYVFAWIHVVYWKMCWNDSDWPTQVLSELGNWNHFCTAFCDARFAHRSLITQTLFEKKASMLAKSFDLKISQFCVRTLWSQDLWKSMRGSEEFQSDGGQHRWHLGTCRWTPEVRAVYKDLQECCSFGLEGLFLFIKFLTARDAAAGVQREAREKRCCGCCGCCFWMFRFFVLTIPGGGRGRSTCHRTGTAAWEPFAKAAGVYLSTLDLRYSTWTRSTKTIKTIKTYKFIQIIHVIV